MKYFEFNNHEYWALVAAESVEKAYEVYAEEVAGETVEQVTKEGAITEISNDVAFVKYRTADTEKRSLLELTNDFNSLVNTTVLITSTLA